MDLSRTRETSEPLGFGSWIQIIFQMWQLKEEYGKFCIEKCKLCGCVDLDRLELGSFVILDASFA